MKLHILGTLSVLLLGSCATEYGSMTETGGYQTDRISGSEFLVDFAGNGFTKKEKANDFALLRAAEVTLEYGFQYFTIEADRDLSAVSAYSSGSTSYTTGAMTTYGNTGSYYGTTTTTPQTNYVYTPGTRLRIKCYVERPTGHIGKIYGAAETASRIKAKHEIE